MRLNDLPERRAIVGGEMRSITEKPTGTVGKWIAAENLNYPPRLPSARLEPSKAFRFTA